MNRNLSVYFIIFLGLITAGYFFIAKIVGEKTEKNPANYIGADFTIGGKLPVKEPEILETPNGYDLFMTTIRDYDYSANKVSGPSRAIFTFRKAAL